jgi:hypothetical protein
MYWNARSLAGTSLKVGDGGGGLTRRFQVIRTAPSPIEF